MLHDGPEDAPLSLVLAHGAGAPMDTAFMAFFAQGLGARGHRVRRFEFAYMAKRRQDGKRRPPDRQPALLAAWREAIADLAPARTAIGGKSMGGRMASLIADEAGVAGLVCLGYPFHPAGKPDRLRTEHLVALKTPSLIVQGTRDALGNETLVRGLNLSPAIGCAWAGDGNHDLVPRKASGRAREQNWADAVAAVDEFLNSLPG